jgi:hypothetical protein
MAAAVDDLRDQLPDLFVTTLQNRFEDTADAGIPGARPKCLYSSVSAVSGERQTTVRLTGW